MENQWRDRIVSRGMVDPSQLLANELNWRIHPLFQQNVVEESLGSIGWIRDVVVNVRGGEEWGSDRNVQTVLDGHLRVKSAMRNGQSQVPVTYVDLSPEEERMALAVLDSSSDLAGTDPEKLAELLDMTDPAGLAMAKLFEDMEKAAGLFDGMEDLGEEQDRQDEPIEPDRGDQLVEKYGVKQGQVWQVGRHYIACGDCRDATTYGNLLGIAGVGKVQGVFTSPPYAQQRAKKDEWYGGVDEDQYVEWWQNVQYNVMDCLEETGSFFLNIKPNVVDGQRVLYVFDLVTAMVRKHGWCLIDEFCWERSGNPGKWKNRFKNGFEPVYQFAQLPDIFFDPYAVAVDSSGSVNGRDNVNTGTYYNMQDGMEWEQALPSNRVPHFGSAEAVGHPAGFPPGLPAWFMKAFSKNDSVWLDPFAGGGTVAISAEQTNRTALLIEIDPRYVAISLERLSNYLETDQPQKLVD